jgi:hypothetical protein
MNIKVMDTSAEMVFMLMPRLSQLIDVLPRAPHERLLGPLLLSGVCLSLLRAEWMLPPLERCG